MQHVIDGKTYQTYIAKLGLTGATVKVLVDDKEHWVDFNPEFVGDLWSLDDGKPYEPYPAAEDLLSKEAARIVHKRITEKDGAKKT